MPPARVDIKMSDATSEGRPWLGTAAPATVSGTAPFYGREHRVEQIRSFDDAMAVSEPIMDAIAIAEFTKRQIEAYARILGMRRPRKMLEEDPRDVIFALNLQADEECSFDNHDFQAVEQVRLAHSSRSAS